MNAIYFPLRITVLAEQLRSAGLPFTPLNVMRENLKLELSSAGWSNPESLLAPPDKFDDRPVLAS